MKDLRVDIGAIQLFLEDVGRGLTEPRIALARFGQRDVRVYAKCIGPAAIAAELYGALLARFAGFSCPQPGLALDLKSETWWFTSEARKTPDLSRRFAVNDASGEAQIHALTQAFKWLVEKPKFPALVAWDEWVSNRDRNFQNILVDGNDFAIIDHEQAFDCHHPGLGDINVLASLVNTSLPLDLQLRIKVSAVAGALSFSAEWVDEVYNTLTPLPSSAVQNLGTIRNWTASRCPRAAQEVERRLQAGQSGLPI